jgi:hypothetical protein
MRHQPPDRDRYEDENLEELGTPVYQGDGLTVRGLDAEELQRFLDAHAGQPAERLGSGWAALDPPGRPHGVPRTPTAAEAPGPLPAVPAGPVAGSLGSPGRSALTRYRRRRALELAAGRAAWPGGCPWSPPPASPDRRSPSWSGCRGPGWSAWS